MTLLDILRSRRRVETKLVYAYICASEGGRCYDDDNAIAAYLGCRPDNVTKALTALIQEGHIVMRRKVGTYCYIVASNQEALASCQPIEEKLSALLKAMGSTLQAHQVKGSDRNLAGQQSAILSDAKAFQSIVDKLPDWLPYARKNLWPLNDGREIRLADVLRCLQDIHDWQRPRARRAKQEAKALIVDI